MPISPLAGRPVPKELLIDVSKLEREYYARRPDMGDPNQRVAFGTSGHRGTPGNGTFTEAHILAITLAMRARAPASFARTAPCGPPIKTARSCACSPRR
jgi:hypothetical protein